MRAFSVSCGTRLAPRNSNPSITWVLAGIAGTASCCGVSSCGRWPVCGVAGVAGVVAGGVVWVGAGVGAVGMVSNGLAGRVAGGVAGGLAGGVVGGVCCWGCAGGCWAGAWANKAVLTATTQTHAGIT